MTETTDSSRLHRALAWIGVVAGVVFIVAVIFFSGFVVGRSAGGYGWHRGPGGPVGCPMMQQGGMRPGMMGPGGMMDPDDTGPGMAGPGRMVPKPTPTPPTPRP